MKSKDSKPYVPTVNRNKKDVQEQFEKKFGEEAKRPKWEILCIETKNHPDEPKTLITGEVAFIYPTGDIALNKILKMELWNASTNTIKEALIPESFKKALKIDIRREIIASVCYLKVRDEEKDEEKA